jgi:hypothetical protein
MKGRYLLVHGMRMCVSEREEKRREEKKGFGFEMCLLYYY